MRDAVTLSLSGKILPNVMVEKPLVSNFEILNLVPVVSKVSDRDRNKDPRKGTDTRMTTGTKWRRVGLVLGKKVHLDTIVWPGGDIVVSGMIFSINFVNLLPLHVWNNK